MGPDYVPSALAQDDEVDDAIPIHDHGYDSGKGSSKRQRPNKKLKHVQMIYEHPSTNQGDINAWQTE